MLAALALMHLIALHDSAGSGNPLGVSGNYDRLPFAPYFIFKDLITIFIFILVLSVFVFFMPNILGDSENYVMANPMQTPPAIVPEWYLLPFYAILRSIPNKLLGVIAMFSAILILLAMPFTDLSRYRGLQFRPLSKIAFFIFVGNFLILMQLGAKHVESPFIEFGQISTVIYFAHFLIIVPLVSLLENSLTELASKQNEIAFNPVVKTNTNISHSTFLSYFGFINTCIVIFYVIFTYKYIHVGYHLPKNCIVDGSPHYNGKCIQDYLDLSKDYHVDYLRNYYHICDTPRPWGIYFQDSATPQMEGIVELHDNILFYLVIILFGVGWMLVTTIKDYTNTESPISHKYLSHGTLIELIWTITPALILILIAFPSFKLLYLMDEVSDPSMAVLAEGFVLFLSDNRVQKKNGGLKLHILNKMKYTHKIALCQLNMGEKNNILVLRPVQVNSICLYNIKLIRNNLTVTNQTNIIFNRTFHTKIRAFNRIGPHNQDIISVIVGSLLGDGYANARTIEGTRFCFRQSIIHKDYLFWLYDFFHSRGYCSNLTPRMYTRKLINKNFKEIKVFNGYEFNTFTFRSFNWIHKLFYNKGKKTINSKLDNYLTPLALAIWIMDDGGWAKPGVRISANMFKLEEVKFLASLLKKNWDLDCTVQKISIANQYSIYIKGKSVIKLIRLVLPHIVPSMYYKLGLVNHISYVSVK